MVPLFSREWTRTCFLVNERPSNAAKLTYLLRHEALLL